MHRSSWTSSFGGYLSYSAGLYSAPTNVDIHLPPITPLHQLITTKHQSCYSTPKLINVESEAVCSMGCVQVSG